MHHLREKLSNRQPIKLSCSVVFSLLILSIVLFCDGVNSQYYMTTLGGSGTAGYIEGTATSGRFNGPNCLFLTTSNVMYIADGSNSRIRKLESSVISTYAGAGSALTTGDTGPAISANFNVPAGIWRDTMTVFYVTESTGQVVRKISNNIVSTLAGIANVQADAYDTSADAGVAATGALLNNPANIFGGFFYSHCV